MRLALLLLVISFHAAAQNQGLRFIENKGQWSNNIDFQARVPGGRMGVSANGFSIQLLDMEELEHRHLATHGEMNEATGHDENGPVDGHYFQITLLGAKMTAPVVDSPLEGHHNYFLGKDPAAWARKARAYGSILYPNVYDGIDFRVSSLNNDLKYEFVVRPGADPTQIRLHYSGLNRLDKVNGELKLHTILGELTEVKPYCYQHNDTPVPVTVPSEYRLRDNIVSFSFPDHYNESQVLVIDPLLIFSTYSGSTADNWGSTATPGEHGTLYSAGVTRQNLGGAFPATVGSFQTSNHGNFDMGIIKYDSAGTKFLYATHLGGVGNDSPASLVVDKNTGDLLVLGLSSSSDYPTGDVSYDRTFNGGTTITSRVIGTSDQWDIVITRLSPDGSELIGSSFLGGSDNDGLNFPKHAGGPLVVNYGDEMRGDVITDDNGYVYISSVTSSANFPIVNGFDNSFGGTTDGVVIKMTPDLSSIVWSSYIGGTGFDAAYSIKFDNDKNIVLAGGTTSTNFPVTGGSWQTVFKGLVDGWIARVAADGSSILNATFTGTNSFDQVYFVDLNASGDVFCYGQTAGQMPVTPGVYNNPNSGQFLQRFSGDLSTLQLSTVFGSGSTNGLVIPNISPTAFLVNDCNNIYMAGWGGYINSNPSLGFWQSSTFNMPITSDAHQKTTSGSDFYFIVLNGDATKLVYSTYLGGSASKTHVDGGTSRFDKYGIVYHAVCSGCTSGNTTGRASSDFPTSPNAKSRLNLSANCNNAAFKFDLSSLRAMFDTNNLALTKPGFNNVCYPDTIVFQNLSTGGRSITWDFDDGTILNQTNTDTRNVLHKYKQAGQYRVKLKILDLSTCSQTDSITKVINYFRDNIQVIDDANVCDGNSFQLTASGGVSYTWTSKDGTFFSSAQSPVVNPKSAATYYVTVVDGNGCMRKDTVNISVTLNVHAAFTVYDAAFSKPDYDNICFPEPLRLKNLSLNGETFSWDFDDGKTATQTKLDTVSIMHAYKQQGTYTIQLTAENPNTCNKRDVATKTISYFKEEIDVGEDGEICEGTTYLLSASGGKSYSWISDDAAFASSAASPEVRPVHDTKYYVTIKDIHGCVYKDTTAVAVHNSVELDWQHSFDGNCADLPSVLVRNLTPAEEGVSFLFDFGDGTTSNDNQVQHSYAREGVYLLKLTARRAFCDFDESIQLPVYRSFVPNVFTPDASPGLNDYFDIRIGETMITPADAGLKVQLTVVDRWGKNVFESQDYRNDWSADGLPGGVYFVLLKVGDLGLCKNWVHVVK